MNSLASLRGDTRTWRIERIRDKAAALARKRLRVVRDSDRAEELANAKRDCWIGMAIGCLSELKAEGEKISKAALARKLNRGHDKKGGKQSTRTQATNKALLTNKIKWEDLKEKAGVNLTKKRRR